MPENETSRSEAELKHEPQRSSAIESRSSWMELLKAVAMPLVTLILGFVFNASITSRQASENAALSLRQQSESNMRLYAEMMGRREQADSDLRKDMFKSILDTFMSKDPKLRQDQQLRQEVLNLELLAFNFHESLDIAPLFKDVNNRIPREAKGFNAGLRGRLEKVAWEVIERQLTVVSDIGTVARGDTLPQEIDDLQAYLVFGSHTVPDPETEPGKGVPRLCMFVDSTDQLRHYRQFKLEIIKYDPLSREVQVRLYVSKVLDEAECQKRDLDLVGKREVDTNFWVGLFDFPLIDNTRLTLGERCAVAVIDLTPNSLRVAVAYFPGSRASMKDKPYYDEMMHELLFRHRPGATEHRPPGEAS